MLISSRYSFLPCDPHEGFSDDDLQRLSCLQSRTEAGLAPWASWEVENSSFGHTLRDWTGYPAWLPICACSDHGVHWESRCWPNEIESPYQLYLTWNSKKARNMRNNHKKKVQYIPHPWVAYRKKHFPKTDHGRKGTIVFYTHSNSTTTPVFKSLDSYMQSLRDLPSQFHPIVLCLSFHDVLKGFPQKLRKYGFPIVSAGTTASTLFVDRFYSISSRFAYSCSPALGSHTYYLVESGLPFFLHGDPPTYFIKGSNAVSDGEQDWREYGDDEDIEHYRFLHDLFSNPVEFVTPEQSASVAPYLGLDSIITLHSLKHTLLNHF